MSKIEHVGAQAQAYARQLGLFYPYGEGDDLGRVKHSSDRVTGNLAA
jgi:hypothetical protein